MNYGKNGTHFSVSITTSGFTKVIDTRHLQAVSYAEIGGLKKNDN